MDFTFTRLVDPDGAKCEKWIIDDDGDEYNDHDYN